MNRLQKKCIYTATAFHLLLLVILLVGPAFLSSHDAADNLQVLEFMPMMTTDKPFSGGGNPNAAPPPPAPAPPQPPVQPTPPPQPQQKVTPPPEPPKKDPDAVEPVKDNKRKPEVSTQLVSRKDVKNPPKQTKPSTADTQQADSRARAAKAAARRLREGLSSRTDVDMPGPGGGGPTYANYRQLVSSIYYQAWIEPDADASTCTASVTIGRDGTVLTARIIKSSGSAMVDRSVQATLDRVKFIAPFPEGAKEEQRTFNINFNLEAKKLSG